MGRNSSTNRMRPDNFVVGPEGIPQTSFDIVGPNYFATMGVPLLGGRDIAKTDTTSSEPVLVINQTMARLFFSNQDPVGRQMLWGAGEKQTSLKVVGVAPDLKQNTLRGDAEPRFYIPHLQHPERDPASARFI